MDKEARKKTIKLIEESRCHKDLKCANLDFERVLKAKGDGLEICFKCMEDDNSKCPFADPPGYENCCECPTRKFIAIQFNK
jgi:hypothetical protein